MLHRNAASKLKATHFASWRHSFRELKVCAGCRHALSECMARVSSRMIVKWSFKAFVSITASSLRNKKWANVFVWKRFLCVMRHFFHTWRIDLTRIRKEIVYRRRINRWRKFAVFREWRDMMALSDQDVMSSEKIFVILNKSLKDMPSSLIDEFTHSIRKSISVSIDVAQFYVDVKLDDMDESMVAVVSLYAVPEAGLSAYDLSQTFLMKSLDPGSNLRQCPTMKDFIDVKTGQAFWRFLDAKKWGMLQSKARRKLSLSACFYRWMQSKDRYLLLKKKRRLLDDKKTRKTLLLRVLSWREITSKRLKELEFTINCEQKSLQVVFNRWRFSGLIFV